MILPRICSILFLSSALPLWSEVIWEEDFEGPPGTDQLLDDWTISTKEDERGRFAKTAWQKGDGSAWVATSTFDPKGKGGLSQAEIVSRETFMPKKGETLAIQVKFRLPEDKVRGNIFTVGLSNAPEEGEAQYGFELQVPTTLSAENKKDSVRLCLFNNYLKGSRSPGVVQMATREINADFAEDQTFLFKWSEKRVEVYLIEASSEQKRYVGGFYTALVPTQEPLHFIVSSYGASKSDSEGFDSAFLPVNTEAENRYLAIRMESIKVERITK